MGSKLSQLTETIIFSDSDEFYTELDPGGARLPRRAKQQVLQRYLPMPQSAITGLALSNNTGDANNDINIAAGRAVDGTGVYNLIATALIKQLDAVWAVGTNQGGLDTGAKANSTWYHVWIIARVDTHVIDVLFSASATAPTMPANYTMKRRIGAVCTDSSGNLIPFLQYGDEFRWKSPPFLDVDDSALTTARKDYTLSGVPGGLVLDAFMNLKISQASTGTAVYLSNPNLTDIAPHATALPLSVNMTTGSAGYTGQVRIFTDTSAKISARSTAASTTIKASVLGWTDPRGKW